jgi:hypothetical protein
MIFPAAATVIMMLIVYSLNIFLRLYLNPILRVFVAIVIGIVIYFLQVLLLRQDLVKEISMVVSQRIPIFSKKKCVVID